jgi:glycosyltransferase involved in cell wall biosynthesis
MTTLEPRDLRVVLFSETFLPKLDGVVTITCLLLDHLRKIGAQALMISPGEHPESYNGYPVHSMPGVPMPMYPEIKVARLGRRTFNAIEAFNPNLVHIINPMLTGPRMIAFARRLNRPLVMSFHTHVMYMAQFYKLGYLEKPLWALHRYYYRKAHYRLATSKRIVAELEAHNFGPTGLWRRGVDAQVFAPGFRDEAMRSRLTDGHPERTVLLFCGRVAAEKQIEQIAEVLKAIPNTHLAIVGDGPYRPALEEIYKDLPATFVGYLKGEELSAAYASSDIFVFPSAIETFGLVVAEAMAAGLPVVSSRVGGVPEIIDHDQNGFIFEPNDIPTMIDYVRRLVDQPEMRPQIGEAAREAVKNLTWDAIMDELIADYLRVIASYPQPYRR